MNKPKAEAKAKATKKRAKSTAKAKAKAKTTTTTTACAYYSSISISRSLAAAGQRRSSHLLMGFALSSKLELIFNDEQQRGRVSVPARGCDRERNNIIETAAKKKTFVLQFK